MTGMNNPRLFTESLKAALDTPLSPMICGRLRRLVDELEQSLLTSPWWMVEAQAREIALGAASLALNGDRALGPVRYERRLDGPAQNQSEGQSQTLSNGQRGGGEDTALLGPILAA